MKYLRNMSFLLATGMFLKYLLPINQSPNHKTFLSWGQSCFRCHLLKDGAPLFRRQRDADVDVQNLLQLVHLCHPVDLLISVKVGNQSDPVDLLIQVRVGNQSADAWYP